MILLAAGIINRILGFIPRIALPRIIGAEGVGLYQLGYPFMSVLVTIVTGGIPLAVAKWVAEARSIGDRHGERKIFRTAMTLAIVLSTLLAVLAALAAPWVTTRVLTDPRVYTDLHVDAAGLADHGRVGCVSRLFPGPPQHDADGGIDGGRDGGPHRVRAAFVRRPAALRTRMGRRRRDDGRRGR